MTQWNTDNRAVLGILSSLAAGTMAFFALAYVRRGRRGEPSPLLPQMVEEQLDRLTSWLDTRFGEVLVDRGMDALHQALRGSAPDKLMQLLEHVLEPDALEPKGASDSRQADGMTVRAATPTN